MYICHATGHDTAGGRSETNQLFRASDDDEYFLEYVKEHAQPFKTRWYASISNASNFIGDEQDDSDDDADEIASDAQSDLGSADRADIDPTGAEPFPLLNIRCPTTNARLPHVRYYADVLQNNCLGVRNNDEIDVHDNNMVVCVGSSNPSNVPCCQDTNRTDADTALSNRGFSPELSNSLSEVHEKSTVRNDLCNEDIRNRNLSDAKYSCDSKNGTCASVPVTPTSRVRSSTPHRQHVYVGDTPSCEGKSKCA